MSTISFTRLNPRQLAHAALIALAIAAAGRGARAQGAPGSGRVSRISAVMPAVAVVRHVAASRVQARRAGRVEMTTAVTVAANTEYAVTVRPVRALPAGVRVSVRNANGVYVPLGDAPVRVARGGRGTTEREIALRVEGSGDLARTVALALAYGVDRTSE